MISKTPNKFSASTKNSVASARLTSGLAANSDNPDAPNKTETATPIKVKVPIMPPQYTSGPIKRLPCDCLENSETVIGIIGKTHGVRIAKSPAPKARATKPNRFVGAVWPGVEVAPAEILGAAPSAGSAARGRRDCYRGDGFLVRLFRRLNRSLSGHAFVGLEFVGPRRARSHVEGNGNFDGLGRQTNATIARLKTHFNRHFLRAARAFFDDDGQTEIHGFLERFGFHLETFVEMAVRFGCAILPLTSSVLPSASVILVGLGPPGGVVGA